MYTRIMARFLLLSLYCIYYAQGEQIRILGTKHLWVSAQGPNAILNLYSPCYWPSSLNAHLLYPTNHLATVLLRMHYICIFQVRLWPSLGLACMMVTYSVLLASTFTQGMSWNRPPTTLRTTAMPLSSTVEVRGQAKKLNWQFTGRLSWRWFKLEVDLI